jgi:anthranilate phosphoribosyltransferase
MVLRQLLRQLGSDRRGASNLTRDDAYRAFAAILGGGESEILIAAFLVTLRWKGVTVEELMGFAQAARDAARMPCVGMPGLVTLCSSHDGHEQFPPLEVASGLIAAAAGARVLILTDRNVPPLRGLTTANVLEALGLSMTWDPTEAEDWVAKGRFAAISVSGMLPAMAALRRIRGDVVLRTPLSTIEKLLAPVSSAVVMGAQGGPVLGTAVEVIQGIGHPRAIALQGVDGSTIPWVKRRTRGIEIGDQSLVPITVQPADFGLECESEPELPMFGPPEDGAGAADNPKLVAAAGDVTLGVLRGESGPARNASLLAAALILKVAGRCLTLAEGVDSATAALESGGAGDLLERLRTFLA